MTKKTIEDIRIDGSSFWAHVDAMGDCWQWTGTTNTKGYGRFNVSGRQAVAHRVAFEVLVGPIADALQLDHLCRNRGCVNPDHLEPVTRRENILRGYSRSARLARQTACKRGHLFSEANTYVLPSGWRRCRTCLKAANREFRLKKLGQS
jgi:hypothetical protein